MTNHCNWFNFQSLKKSEAVGELHVPWCESELNHRPSKFHFWIKKLLFFFLLRSRKPKRDQGHDDRSQFELSTWSSSGKKKLSLNLAASNNASLTSGGHWSLEHVPSLRIIHRSIKFVAFALVPVFWHFRWIQKWLQSIQGPCGSFRKFSIQVKSNFTLKPPRSPCLDSDGMHGQGLRRDNIRDFAFVSRISLLWMTNERLVCSERHWYRFCKFWRSLFVVDLRTLVSNLGTCTQRMFGRKTLMCDFITNVAVCLLQCVCACVCHCLSCFFRCWSNW